MKVRTLFILIIIGVGILFTVYCLNNEIFNAKEKYVIYAFQTGSFETLENANQKINDINTGIVINEENMYKIYVGLYKNIDTVNKMLVYFEDNDINIYLKDINVSKRFYNEIDNFEKILGNSEDTKVYEKVNEAILELYKEDIL